MLLNLKCMVPSTWWYLYPCFWIDLIRTSKNSFYVLEEDNLRVPSGASYMIESINYDAHVSELFTNYNVKNVYDYPDLLLKSLIKCSSNLSIIQI